MSSEGRLQCPKIVVLSRREILKFRGAEAYAVISIRSPDDPVLHLRPDALRLARINLAFYDTTPEWESRLGLPVEAMTELQAQRIAKFAVKHASAETMVVHCLAGISRSSGVAAGISAALGGDDGFLRPRHGPNPHVLQLVCASIKAILYTQFAKGAAGRFVMMHRRLPCNITNGLLKRRGVSAAELFRAHEDRKPFVILALRGH